jgi:chemotaxis protein CheD
MANLVIGIGDCQVSADPADILITHALGSCIAVMIHDPVAKVAGLLHFMLPESSIDLEKVLTRPFAYADTGIPLLFKNAYQLGAVKSRIRVMAAGGAQMLDPNGTFNIGKRNHLAMRKIFWKAGVLVQKEEVGGVASRTVRIDVAAGRVLMRTAAGPEQEFLLSAAGAPAPSSRAIQPASAPHPSICASDIR